jgi:hypothetical protein
MHRAPAVPGYASARHPDHQPARAFVEERRRLNIIPNAFGERAVLKLMFGAMIRTSDRWHATRITEFERRQMAAVKKELDEEYEGTTTTPSSQHAETSTTLTNIEQFSDLTLSGGRSAGRNTLRSTY